MRFVTTNLDAVDPFLENLAQDLLVLDTVLHAVESNSARLRLTASFVPAVVEHGLIIKGDLYIGCTGALVQLRAIDAALDDFSRSSFLNVDTEEEVEKSVEAGVELSTPAGVAARYRRATTSTTSFSSQEGQLIATPQGPNLVRWSFFSHRGAKAVRDYLEGCLSLSALCSWFPDRRPRLLVSARASDRRFYSNDRRELSKLKSIALAAKLISRGVRLPTQRTRSLLIEGV